MITRILISKDSLYLIQKTRSVPLEQQLLLKIDLQRRDNLLAQLVVRRRLLQPQALALQCVPLDYCRLRLIFTGLLLTRIERAIILRVQDLQIRLHLVVLQLWLVSGIIWCVVALLGGCDTWGTDSQGQIGNYCPGACQFVL